MMHQRWVLAIVVSAGMTLAPASCKHEPSPVATVIEVTGEGATIRPGANGEWVAASPRQPLAPHGAARTTTGQLALSVGGSLTVQLRANSELQLPPRPDGGPQPIVLTNGSLTARQPGPSTLTLPVEAGTPMGLTSTSGPLGLVIIRDPPPAVRYRFEALEAFSARVGENQVTIPKGEAVTFEDGIFTLGNIFSEYEAEPGAIQLTRRGGPVTIVGASGKVAIRRVGTDTWLPVTPGMQVNPEDEVKTDPGAKLVARFDGGAEIEVVPGSVVVFRESRSDSEGSHKVASLFIKEGMITVRMPTAPETPTAAEPEVTLRVLSPQGLVRVRSQTESRSVVDVTMGAGEMLVVETRIGRVEVISKGGKETATNGQSIEVAVDATGAPTLRTVVRTLSAKPIVVGAPPAPVPLGDATVRVSAKERVVALSWRPVFGAQSYEFQASRDKEFNRLFLKENTKATTQEFENQGEPVIYWRVRAVGKGKETGSFSDTRRVEFTSSTDRPTGRFFGGGADDGGGLSVRIVSPQNNAVINAMTTEVRGSVSDAERVVVNNKTATQNGEGEFSAEVELKEGLNQIVVEAVDAGGKRKHAVRSVFCKPQ